MPFGSIKCPRFEISRRRSICCENFMSTWPKAKVLNKYPTELDKRGEIGENHLRLPHVLVVFLVARVVLATPLFLYHIISRLIVAVWGE